MDSNSIRQALCLGARRDLRERSGRKKSDEDLRRFRAAMDISGDAILLIDRASMRYVDVNQTFCEMVGYTREEMLGMTPMDLFSADRNALERDYDAIIADGNSSASKVEGRYRRKDGTAIPVETRRRALRTENGWIIVGTARDITERKDQEAKLAASEARFSAAFRSAPNALSITRRSDGAFVEVNEGYERASGRSAADVVGRTASELGIWVDAAERDAYLAGLARDGSVRDQRVHLRAKDGKVRICEISAADITIGGERFTIAQTRDLTPVVQARREQQASERKYRAMFDSALDGIVILSTAGILVDVNPAGCCATGYLREELVGQHISALIGAAEFAHRPLNPEKVYAAGSVRAEREILRKDGSLFMAEILAGPLPDGNIQAIVRDISERKRDEHRLARHARRQESIARFGQFALGKHNPEQLFEEAVRTVHAHGADAAALYELVPATEELVVRAAEGNGAASSVGGSAPLPQDSPLKRIMAEGTPFLADRPYLSGRSDGTPWGPWVRRMGNAIYAPVRGEGGPFGVLAMYSEHERAFGDEDLRFVEAIGNVLSTALQRHQAERRLAYLAQFDALTGLPNRNLVQDRLTQTIVQSRRNRKYAAVLYIDLDRFKLVNDSFGHKTGDGLITQVGQRLARCIRQGDTLGRISGDEFAVVLADLAHPDDAAIVAQKVLDALAKPLNLDGHETYITGSIGISVFPGDGEEAETLLKNADTAMYRVKKSARNGYRFFTSKMNQRSVARMQINTDLRHAIARNEFQLFYQPKVDLVTGALTGTEALLRWNHPQRGMVSPAEFIPALEDSGLIVTVGEWVIHEACRQVQAWRRDGFEPVPVAINLSARQFRRKDLDAEIRRVLSESGVPPCLLDLEITESSLVEDPEDAVRVLGNLRAAGLKISVDDFGTGYSSLAYLTRFPLSAVKIDRSFVNAVDSDGNAAAIVRAVIDMAHNLRYTVIAEGVETERQSAFLRQHGCDQAQGYLFGRPMPAHDMAKRLLKTSGP